MIDRIGQGQDNEADKQKRIQEEIQRRIQAIMAHASELYDLLEPGMTVAVYLEETPSIVTPNHAPKVRRILITRPAMMLEVK